MSANGNALTVLVADDDEEDRGFIKKAWTKSRTTNDLRFVEDGEELTQYLTHSGKYRDPASAPRPAMILLDLYMPRKDGREALREIKADPKLRQIPVIVLTTSKSDDDIWRIYDLGANAHITKPTTFGGLVDILGVLGKHWMDVVDLAPGHTWGANLVSNPENGKSQNGDNQWTDVSPGPARRSPVDSAGLSVNWSTAKPAAPGVYMYHGDAAEGIFFGLVTVMELGGTLCALGPSGSAVDFVSHLSGHWAGPIDPPRTSTTPNHEAPVLGDESPSESQSYYRR